MVSYVINDGPRRVSDDARARVLAAIAELGYQRDGVARMLAMGRSLSIALVVPDIGIPYFGRVANSISTLASAQGYQLLVGTTNWDLDVERTHLRALAERRVEGIILMSVDPSQDFAQFSTLGIPVAIVDRPEFAVEGSAAATEHLIGHGHRTIGMIGASIEFIANRRRRDGWLMAMHSAGLQTPDDLMVSADFSSRGGYEGVGRLLTSRPDITALYVSSDLQAIGTLRRLHELGIRVPEDLALMTSDATDIAEFAVPSISSLAQPELDIAEIALDAVLGAGAEGVKHIDVLGYELVLRESCGCTTTR
ncbi:LacI family DNA-binding transcriptional regulator [Subtercola frigoramans]